MCIYMQKDFFKNKKRSMAYAFFIEGIEVAWTREKLMQNDREKETKKNQQKNVYQKEKKVSEIKKKNDQCLFSFTVSVEFSCKYVSDNIYFKKKLKIENYNIVECEG
uniref:Uncharacterized protein n=1 Tax=Micrurus surinamensis TaxID=129470 RepID=A0A2D4PE02_MICSU